MTRSDIYDRRFDEDVQTPNNACPECDGLVTTNTSETVCEDCGLVIDETPVDHGPEWRTFEETIADDETPQRTGAPLTPTQHDRGLATRIGHDDTDGQDNDLSASQRRRAYTLRREQGRTVRQSTAERNRMQGIYEIRRVTSRLELGEAIRDQACALFRTAQAADLLRGRSIEAVAAACVYAVCRCTERPVTMADIRPYARESATSLEAAYGALNEQLDLPTPPRRPREFVPRFVAELNPPERRAIERRTIALAEQATDHGHSIGQNPRGVAAGCLYQALQERDIVVTQAAVADIAGVTVVTVRRHWRAVADLCGSGAD